MTLNLNHRPTWLILLFCAMLLILVSCEKSERFPEGGDTMAEKGKPLPCGVVIYPSDIVGKKDVQPFDYFDNQMFCGTLPVTGENSIAVNLKYDETFKVSYNYLAQCSEIELITQFEDKQGDLTDPSDQRIRVWDGNGNSVGYSLCCPSVISGLTPGQIYRIGVAVGPCNLRQCSAQEVHFKVECV